MNAEQGSAATPESHQNPRGWFQTVMVTKRASRFALLPGLLISTAALASECSAPAALPGCRRERTCLFRHGYDRPAFESSDGCRPIVQGRSASVRRALRFGNLRWTQSSSRQQVPDVYVGISQRAATVPRFEVTLSSDVNQLHAITNAARGVLFPGHNSWRIRY